MSRYGEPPIPADKSRADKIVIQNIHTYIWDRFVYTKDVPPEGQTDDWRSSWNEIIQDPTYKIYDDCDGYAATMAHGLIHSGYPAFRLAVAIDGERRNPNHMVALTQDADGTWWICGDCNNKKIQKLKGWNEPIFHINYAFETIEWVDWKAVNHLFKDGEL